MSKIFISHSSSNNAPALAVAAWLEENGWGEYFLDVNPQLGLAPGERWQEALKAAADRCEAVLFLISPAWRDSRWCLAEFLLAKQLGKKVFGVLIEPTPLESLPKEITAEWQLCDLTTGTERRAFSVKADVVPETAVSFGVLGLERLKIGLQRAGLDPLTFAWPPPDDPERPPYRGLRPLESDDAAIFFGRESAIVRGLDTLRQVRERGVENVFVILGASGAGKSSFLRAGLWPRLARDGRHFLPLPIIRPQAAVLTGSAGLVVSVELAFRERRIKRNRADIRAALEARGGLARVVAELQTLAHTPAEADGPPPTVLIAIDQAEELFVSDGRAENDAFLEILGQTLGSRAHDGPASAPGVVLLAAIRSEAYNRLQSDPHLAAATQVPFNLSQIPRSEFKHIITGPAARATAAGRILTLDPMLTERLLQDAEGPDALPLLAFTLERLFVDYGADGVLNSADYDALGGVRGSIEAAVEAAFENPGREPAVPPDKAERERLLRQAFIPWLAGVDPDTDERRRRVARWEDIPPDARGVVDRLVEIRLLIRDRRAIEGGTQTAVVVEVAHEALLRQWPTLTTWLDDDADSLKTVEGVRRAAAEWMKNQGNAAWLVHTGERLDAADGLRQRRDLDHLMGPLSRDYLAACRDRDERLRADREAQVARISAEQARTAVAQRRSRSLLAAVAIALAGFAAWIVVQSRDVSRQQSRVLIVAADEALNRHVRDRALRFSVLAAGDSLLAPAVPDAQLQLARVADLSSELARITHDARVQSAAFSPDGRRIVTASIDKTARVVDARTAAEVLRIAHDDAVAGARFSPDGRSVVTIAENKVRLVDVETGRTIAAMAHGGRLSDAVFSPDGRRLLTSSWDFTAKLIDAQNGAELSTLRGDGSVSFAIFNPGGDRIIVGSGPGTVQVFDAESRKELTRFSQDTANRAVAFSRDGERLAVGNGESAQVFDAGTWKEVWRFASSDRVSVLAFSPDSRRLVIGSGRTVFVLEPPNDKVISSLEHDSAVTSAAFSPDGRKIVSTSMDGTARISDARDGREILRVIHQGPVYTGAFDPDGQRIATASEDQTARVSDIRGHELARLDHQDLVQMVAFSPDARHIITASSDRTAVVADAQTGAALARFVHDGNVLHVALSPDGRLAATASADGTARVFDLATKAEVARITHELPVVQVEFSPDSRYIVTASKDKTTRILDARTGQERVRLTHRDAVRMAAFSPDGRRILSASDDQSCVEADAQSGKEIVRLTGSFYGAAFSPDGTRIATIGGDKLSRVFDAASGRELVRIEHTNQGRLITFSPDGRRILSIEGGTALVSDAETGIRVFRAVHQGSIGSAAFSPDGRHIATATHRGHDEPPMIRILDIQTGKELARIGTAAMAVSMAFSTDGRRLVTGGYDNAARVWDTGWIALQGRQLIDRVCSEKLVGTRTLTASDIEVAPLLLGRQGEDVCGPAGVLQRIRVRLSR